MLAKGAVVILSIGATACVLLTLRQQRLNAAHDIAEIQARLAEHDRTLMKLKIEIAERVTPEHVRHLTESLGPMVPIGLQKWWASMEAARLEAEAEAEGLRVSLEEESEVKGE